MNKRLVQSIIFGAFLIATLLSKKSTAACTEKTSLCALYNNQLECVDTEDLSEVGVIDQVFETMTLDELDPKVYLASPTKSIFVLNTDLSNNETTHSLDEIVKPTDYLGFAKQLVHIDDTLFILTSDDLIYSVNTLIENPSVDLYYEELTNNIIEDFTAYQVPGQAPTLAILLSSGDILTKTGSENATTVFPNVITNPKNIAVYFPGVYLVSDAITHQITRVGFPGGPTTYATIPDMVDLTRSQDGHNLYATNAEATEFAIDGIEGDTPFSMALEATPKQVAKGQICDFDISPVSNTTPDPTPEPESDPEPESGAPTSEPSIPDSPIDTTDTQADNAEAGVEDTSTGGASGANGIDTGSPVSYASYNVFGGPNCSLNSKNTKPNSIWIVLLFTLCAGITTLRKTLKTS